VEDGDDADHPARAENWNVPEWIVHCLAPHFLWHQSFVVFIVWKMNSGSSFGFFG
jgi:hypothetical protein